ncbi:MAG: L7Ae/L30e/S12e/Gadd45 family ribosomal protein [Butyricicoccaceae bacterium]
MSDGILGLLGLCRRAGRLTIGDEAVSDLCRAGQAHLILLSSDAGESTAKRARKTSEATGVPLIRIEAGREALGAALGRGMCAVCAVSDAGFAAALAKKLAQAEPAYREIAEQLAQSSRPNVKRRRSRQSFRKKSGGERT